MAVSALANASAAATLGPNSQNLLDLRELGPTRALVLPPGGRVPASNAVGATSINITPQTLVRVVDALAGVASGAYWPAAVHDGVDADDLKPRRGLTLSLSVPEDELVIPSDAPVSVGRSDRLTIKTKKKTKRGAEMSKSLNGKAMLAAGASLVALILAGPTMAFAQDAAATTAADLDEVVVTGSRLQTSGFQAPTPVTVSSAEELRQAAPKNLADALVQLPTFNANTRSDNPATAATGGTNGQNLLNLRGLGPNRNLVLLDGRRLPATNSSGSVDINVMPQNLVSRVDVVTGGASAAYGSDAVAGVVNFILDTKFEGLKGELQGGVSKYHDLGSGKFSLAYGKSLFDGRGRFVASAEAFTQKGVGPNDTTGRDWFDTPAGQIPNPIVGTLPKVLVIADIRNGLGAYGGLISSGPLRGTQFLPGGIPAPFNTGTITGTTFQSGGDGAKINIGFAPDQERVTSFLHGEFDVTDKLTVFAEAHYAYSHVTANDFVNPHTGTANQYTIFRDNAYLPASILARMVTANVQSIPLGRYERDFPPVQIETTTDMERLVAGAKGSLWGSWKFDGAVTYGETNQEISENNLSINRRLYAAADAVRNPANGQIVCRSTLAGLDPGCVPLNLFGEGSVSAEAVKYVTGSSIKYLKLQQTVAAFNINGDLGDKFQLGAGPIAVATGFEYRKEKADQTVDALSPLVTDFTGVRGGPVSQQGRPGSFNFFNPLPLAGSYDIKEGYVEVGVPVLKDLPFVKSLDVNGAARRAVYSQSGGVTTWKIGANYQVFDDLRFRLTKSQDIRGPNILELFNSATQNSNNQIYKGVTTQTLTIASGNPDLKPEQAITLTYGAVYRPSWLPGFQMSLDYYKITIDDAIGTLSAQRTIDECAAGNQLLCNQITVTGAGTLIVRTRGLNLNVQKTAGYDFEAAYATDLAGGRLSLRALINHATVDYTQAPGSPPTVSLDQATSPKWRGSFQARYARDNWSLFLQERFIWKGKFDPTKIEGIDTNDNSVPTIAYTDLTASYKLGKFGGDQELFVSISNLFDQDPPVDTNNPTSFSSPTSTSYDRIARYYTTGIRFRF